MLKYQNTAIAGNIIISTETFLLYLPLRSLFIMPFILFLIKNI